MFDVLVTYYDAETPKLYAKGLPYSEAVVLCDKLNSDPDFDGHATLTEH